MSKTIAIIGGGYAGNMLAKALDDHASITLIEPRDKWVHNVAMIRAMARPELLDEIIIPYDGLLKNGQVMRDRAVSIDGNSIALESGETTSADIIVVATGSHYAAPFKMQGDDGEAYLKTVHKIMGQIDKAQNIAIVGAGAVGCELAGEIAFERPEKNITLISGDELLFPGYSPKLGRSMERQLGELGVKVRLGERIKDLKHKDRPYKPANGKLKLADGFPIDVDLVIPAIGTRPETSLMQSVQGVEIANNGRIKTDAWLRPVPESNLFVVGDIADTGDTMTIVGLSRQVPWLAKTIRAYLSGKPVEDRKPYKPWPKPMILLPLGPDKGASALPFGVVGPFLTRQIKGKKLFIPRYHKEFDWAP